ncbi:hypothetical protein [Prosthecobacter sp.]|uniref:hypothetical protein n=1 Tax=Prosthecobacter sp. TaxID=1965333 RepID=UPI00378333C3
MLPLLISLAAVFLAAIAWLHFYTTRLHSRQLSTLASMTCPYCGHPFGQTTAIASRDRFLAQCNETRLRLPNCKINFARIWPVHCPSCSAPYEFHLDTLQLRSPRPQSSSAV